jgi:hypothetical protein
VEARVAAALFLAEHVERDHELAVGRPYRA